MALLCFPPDQLESPLVELMDPEMRKGVAVKVNEAILRAQGVQPESKVRGLVRLRAWSEMAAARSDGRAKEIPKMNIGLGMAEGNGVSNGNKMQVDV